MYSLTLEEQAYIFSTINSKQKTVNSSLIYDLFGLTAVRSPQKLAHDMARIFNQDSSSPFYKRLKMLGKKDPDQSNATISQGAFVDSVLDLILLPNEMTYKRNFRAHLSIVKDENKIFRKLYIENKDEIILRIIKNCFNAVNEVFPELWTNTESILWKSTGFCGIMMALSEMTRVGWESGDLSIDYFKSVFSKFKQFLADAGFSLSNEHYGSGKAAQRRVSNDITSLLRKN